MNMNFIKWFGANADLVIAVKNAAAKTHEDVNQYYDDKPYIYHLQSVVNEICCMSYSVLPEDSAIYPALLFGAYFHDSIEDARLTYNDVKKLAAEILGNNTDAELAAEYVYALTNEKGRTRAERANDKYYEGIRNVPYANCIKLADRLANYRYSHMTKSSMLKKYEAEMPHFLEAIGCDDVMRNYVDNWMMFIGES